MAGDISIALYDLTKNAIFSKRRLDKAVNGDVGSYAVATGQIRNGAQAVAQIDNAIGRAASTATKAFDATAKSAGAMGYAAKGINWASRHVNPLICVTSGIRVLRADDKTSMAINQAYALAGMFSCEKLAKLALTPKGHEQLVKLGLADKKMIKPILNFINKIDKIACAPGASKWARIGIPAAKAACFVLASICGYQIGSNIGDKINEARKNNTSVFDLPPKAQKEIAYA